MSEPRSFTDERASRLEKLYADADEQITKQIGIYEASGRAPGTTRNLKQLLSNVRKIRADVLKGARTWTNTTIGSSKGPGIAYKAGMEWADKGIPEESEVLPGFFNVHQQAALKIANEIYGRFDEVDQTIGKSVRTVARRIDDVYRQMALAKSQKSVLGYQTARQAAKDLKKDLQERGITGFVDRSGRQWTLQNYSRMAAITTTNNCLREGAINRIQERGHDLIIVSSHSGSCPKCSPWNGKTLSISGEDPDYPSLADARAAQLFHPRCKHAVSLAPAAKDRFLERLQGKQGEAARQAEITRLAEKAGWKNPIKEASPEEFIKQRDKLPKALLNYLTPYTTEGYNAANVKLKLHKSGGGGYGLNGDELISVFSLPGKHLGSELVDDAIANGAKRLDCLGDSLLKFYSDKGFKVVKTNKWDDKYAPEGWDHERFKRPNLYYMELK